MRQKIFPIIGLIIVALEILLCIYGPMALVQKPSLYPAPVYTVNLDDEEVARFQTFLEQSLAQSETFIVRSSKLLEDQILDRGEDFSESRNNNNFTWKDHMAVAEDLNIDRVAITLVFISASHAEMSVTLRDTRTGEKLRTSDFKSDTAENLLNGIGRDGEDLMIPETLGLETKGAGIFDYLLFILFAMQIIILLLRLFNIHFKAFNEGALIWGVLLFLFAWIYARNANMDYVQRFIASNGRINLAASTALEQFYAALRFIPMILLNLIPWASSAAKEWKTATFADRIRHLGPLLAAVSALLFGLSFPSFMNLRGLGIFAWFAFIPLILAIYYSDPGKAVIYTTFFGGLQSVIINYWHGTYSYVSLGFSTGITVAQYIPFAIALVFSTRYMKKWSFITIPIAWVLFDFFRSLGFIGYPWGMIGTSQYAFTSFIQTASLTGAYGLTFMIVLANTAITWIILEEKEKFRFLIPLPALSPGLKNWLSLKLPLALFLLLFIPVIIYGSITKGVLKREKPEHIMHTALVQQNTDPRKHDYTLSFETLQELTNQAIAESAEPLDLIVWPEGAFKSDVRYWTQSRYRQSNRADLVTRFMEYQKSLNTWLLTGTQDHYFYFDDEGEKKRENFNSALLMTPEGEIAAIYHKMHLVPFTESFPYEEEFPALYDMLQKFNASNWGIGSEQQVFHHPKAVFHTPICFEDVFPQDQKEFVKRGSDVFVNISNDYWSITPVEGMQHGIQALFRAVEYRRPMVRSTASGYTVHIDRLGQIQKEAAAFYSPEYILADVEIHKNRNTLYYLWGDWFCWAALGAGIVILMTRGVILFRRRKRR